MGLWRFIRISEILIYSFFSFYSLGRRSSGAAHCLLDRYSQANRERERQRACLSDSCFCWYGHLDSFLVLKRTSMNPIFFFLSLFFFFLTTFATHRFDIFLTFFDNFFLIFENMPNLLQNEHEHFALKCTSLLSNEHFLTFKKNTSNCRKTCQMCYILLSIVNLVN